METIQTENNNVELPLEEVPTDSTIIIHSEYLDNDYEDVEITEYIEGDDISDIYGR